MATEGENEHPPYPQMIIQAIEALDDKNGSNKTSISNYIESNFTGLPSDHSSLLSDHLTRMRTSGELVFLKNNYMKPDPNAAPKRGRGRPPKPKDPTAPAATTTPNLKRPRGRPPKPKDPAAPAPAPTSRRPRGRPPKNPNAGPMRPKVTAGMGRPRGRPRKMARPTGGIGDSAAGAAAAAAGKKGTGRPRGRPPKTSLQVRVES